MIIALVEIADCRFQDGLIKEAKAAGKLRQEYRIPDHARNNRPERLKDLLSKYRERGLFKTFPFGTDLTEDEVVLRKALLVLKQRVQLKKLRLPRLADVGKTFSIPDRAGPYLERMTLDHPQTLKQRLLQRALVYALASVDAI